MRSGDYPKEMIVENNPWVLGRSISRWMLKQAPGAFGLLLPPLHNPPVGRLFV